VHDTLLVLHLFAAFAVFITVVLFSALVLGAPRLAPVLAIANVAWAVGGLGTIVFGIWLAINDKGYDILDGWIIAAIVLWFLATGAGARTSRAVQPTADGRPVAIDSRTAAMHWLRTLLVVALLLVMVYKPGA
jgi:uncharacterized membrane protein